MTLNINKTPEATPIVPAISRLQASEYGDVVSVNLDPQAAEVSQDDPNFIRWMQAAQVLSVLDATNPSRKELLNAAKIAADHLRSLIPAITFLTADIDRQKAWQQVEFEVFEPSLKELNDQWFGTQKETDDFIARVRQFAANQFEIADHPAVFLGKPFKGGSVLISNGLDPEHLQRIFENVEAQAQELLNQKCGDRDQVPQFNIKFGFKQWETLPNASVLDNPTDARQFLVELQDAQRYMAHAKRRAVASKRFVPAPTSVDQNEGTRLATFADLRFAFGRPRHRQSDDRRGAKNYIDSTKLESPHGATFKSVYTAYRYFLNEATYSGVKGRIEFKPGWVSSTEHDTLPGPSYNLVKVKNVRGIEVVVPTEEAIELYRKGNLQEYLNSIGHPKVYHVLHYYIQTVKLLDTVDPFISLGKLKKSTFATEFLPRLKEIVSLLQTWDALGSGNVDEGHLEAFLRNAIKLLTTSLKDQGSKNFGTAYSMIQFFLNHQGDKVLNMGDLIGFGNINLELLSIQAGILAHYHREDHETGCQYVLSSANHLGNAVLYDRKSGYHRNMEEAFPDVPQFSNHDQGDEFADGFVLPEGQITFSEAQRRIAHISKLTYMRTVAVITDLHIDAENPQEAIAKLIAIFKWAEESFGQLKEVEKLAMLGADTPPSCKFARIV